ncbi:MAG: ABC transporter ATP-binding protein [Treponema sp.]|nr:ABC transporter ATP-binding protein [Treponema sp.]
MNVVELRNISKQYQSGNKKANNNISLNVKKGEILCIAGENGAGKTTLMNILYGLEKPDNGEIYINGDKQEIKSAFFARKLGIGMVHQHFMLFPDYTVAENIVMGNEPLMMGIFFDKKKAREISQKIITENKFPINCETKVSELTLGQMQQVEIYRLLNRDAQIIILDEPTSILTETESVSLFKTLKDFADSGKSIIMITHKLHEIKQAGDRAAVLRNGELVGIRNVIDIDEHEIAAMMMGNDEFEYGKKIKNIKQKKNNEPVIAFENVTVKRKNQEKLLLDNVSFSVSSGEILGIAGVGGNGLGVIEAVLGGFLHPVSGKVFHRGKDISRLNTRALRKQGLSYVPADRINTASAKDATIAENIIINRRYDGIKNNAFIEELINKYNIDCPSAGENASTLSGGNLQKLILAREIDWFKDYIVFSQPSWGLDAASSAFVLKQIDELRGKGAAIILISANLDEIIELSDKIIVMNSGRIAGVFTDFDASVKSEIGKCMVLGVRN